MVHMQKNCRIFLKDLSLCLRLIKFYVFTTPYQVSFSAPENFGLDPAFPQSYHQKLSNAVIQAAEQKEGTKYSKRLYTTRFIKQLDSAIAQQKCPEFRQFFTSLSRLTSPSKS